MKQQTNLNVAFAEAVMLFITDSHHKTLLLFPFHLKLISKQTSQCCIMKFGEKSELEAECLLFVFFHKCTDDSDTV